MFRRMRQYMREKERAESRVIELEKRKLELEGAMVSIENCWNQVCQYRYNLVHAIMRGATCKFGSLQLAFL